MQDSKVASKLDDFPCDQVGSLTTQRIFVVALMLLLVAPLVLMPLLPPASDEASSEKRELAPAPRAMVDGAPNPRVLTEAGDYFADHFALRAQFVDLDATLRQNVFLTSATGGVVVGTDGWLYYSGEMGDCQRTAVMSDRAASNAAHNLALVQEVLEAQGKRFVLAIAPNKSTLYPEHLPYYRLQGEGPSSYDKVLAQLKERGVHVVDLRQTFLELEGEWYLKRDSHWTDEGALVAYGAIRSALGRDATLPEADDATNVARVGDLDAMLHPTTAVPEEQAHRNGVDRFVFSGDSTDVEDNYLVTSSTNDDSRGSLLMYRDSFGNALLPSFASAYGQAAFTKLVPYDMGERMCSFADDVVIERAERHLPFFATTPPYMVAPQRSVTHEEDAVASDTSVHLDVNGSYLVVEGTLDESVCPEDARVFVEVVSPQGDTHTYEAFLVSEATDSAEDFEGQQQSSSANIEGDWGYRAYISLEDGEDTPQGYGVRILVGSEDLAIEVGSVKSNG